MTTLFTAPSAASPGHSPQPTVLGRRRDASRRAAILDAALDVLADAGYAKMTMDVVAARAKAGKATMYRRWASKEALVLDAIAHMEQASLGHALPDTGTLRGDMMALIRPQAFEKSERRLKIMTGLVALADSGQAMALAFNRAIIAPWVLVNRQLIERAIARGECRGAANIKAVSTIIPSMAAYRVCVQRKSLTRAFFVTLIDDVFLPALCGYEGMRHGATQQR